MEQRPCLGLPGLVQSWAALPGDLADLGHLEMFRELAAKNQGRRDLEAWATCSQRQGGAQVNKCICPSVFICKEWGRS